MLVENTREEALKAFLNGRKVRVVSEYDDGSASIEKLEEIIPKDFHYLVDVPAYMNPEFEQVMPEPHVFGRYMTWCERTGFGVTAQSYQEFLDQEDIANNVN